MATNDGTNSIYLSKAGGTMTGAIDFSSPTSNGIVGTTAADNASAGTVGEFISSQILFASAISISNSTLTNLTSISLTAGDWEVWGNVNFSSASGTIATVLEAGISPTSATMPDNARTAFVQATYRASTTNTILAPMQRINISATTTYYMVAFATFTVSTMTMSGGIYARRKR